MDKRCNCQLFRDNHINDLNSYNILQKSNMCHPENPLVKTVILTIWTQKPIHWWSFIYRKRWSKNDENTKWHYSTKNWYSYRQLTHVTALYYITLYCIVVVTKPGSSSYLFYLSYMSIYGVSIFLNNKLRYKDKMKIKATLFWI